MAIEVKDPDGVLRATRLARTAVAEALVELTSQPDQPIRAWRRLAASAALLALTFDTLDEYLCRTFSDLPGDWKS